MNTGAGNVFGLSLVGVLVVSAAIINPACGGEGSKKSATSKLENTCTTCAPDEVTEPNLYGWETSEVIFDNGLAVGEKVSYRSDGLKIWGLVCRPKYEGQTYPLIMANHGGADGLLTEWDDGGICMMIATIGYVVMESSYRGEDGSEGEVEGCLGEVDDVLKMLEIGLAQPYVDPEQTGMMGFSHGGCVTLRAVQQNAPVEAAVDVYGPTDWAKEYWSWKAMIEADPDHGRNGDLQRLIDLFEGAAGGDPNEAPEPYALRSPITYVDQIPEYDGSLLIVHGVQDDLVPLDQSCDLAKQAGGFEFFHFDATEDVVTNDPVGCEGYGFEWQADPVSWRWPNDRYMIVYDNLGHWVPSNDAIFLMVDFLLDKMLP